MFYLRSLRHALGYIWRAIVFPFKWWKWAIVDLDSPLWLTIVAALAALLVIVVSISMLIASCCERIDRPIREQARVYAAKREAECTSKGGSLINDMCFATKRIPLSGE